MPARRPRASSWVPDQLGFHQARRRLCETQLPRRTPPHDVIHLGRRTPLLGSLDTQHRFSFCDAWCIYVAKICRGESCPFETHRLQEEESLMNRS